MEIADKKQMNPADILALMRTCEMEDYGVGHKKLNEEFSRDAAAEVVAALDNADTSHVLLDVLKSDAESVFEGMQYAADALGAVRRILYISEEAQEIKGALEETAARYGIEIRSGIVDVRKKEDSLILHLLTYLQIAEWIRSGKEPGQTIWVSVNGQPLQRVPSLMKIAELADCSKAKAIRSGYRFYQPDVLDCSLGEVRPDNGELQILTEKDCLVAKAGEELLASRTQSCGKCVFCREGLIQLQEMHKDITEGRGKMEELARMEEIGNAMHFSCACSLGENAAEIALSAMSAYQVEYQEHIQKKKCPAGVCMSQTTFYIDPIACTGCGECMDVCPMDCIEGRSGYIHMIDPIDCSRCGKCLLACEEGAIQKTDQKLPKLPDRLTKCGRFRVRH